MEKNELQAEIRKRVQKKIFPLLEKYGLETEDLDSLLKWKPMVLFLGNYSSGKSTLINELLGRPVQLTGQAPTDDAFTVITAPEPGEPEGYIPGATLVNDDALPFSMLKSYGDRLVSHLGMKQIDLPALEDLTLVDTPGMLDSVTEKGRGYDFFGVVGHLAKLADLVILMFDPHKAGTIRETYTAIRNTLPLTAEEDRVVFVMGRVDECETPSDLIRSYGTLCWNLSQMSGRKDIPRIFLTHAPGATTNQNRAWIDERRELKEKILAAPELKISHILHLADRKIFEIRIAAEAMQRLTREGRRALKRTLQAGFLLGVLLFCGLDMLLSGVFDIPSTPLIPSLITGTAAAEQFIFPGAGFLAAMAAAFFWFTKRKLPRLKKTAIKDPERLTLLTTDFARTTWDRIKPRVTGLVATVTLRKLFDSHDRAIRIVDTFAREDLRKYFSRIRQPRFAEALDAAEAALEVGIRLPIRETETETDPHET